LPHFFILVGTQAVTFWRYICGKAVPVEQNMATSPSPYPTGPTLLTLNQEEQQWLQPQIQDAVARSWPEACAISQRLLREPRPPDDLWESAIQRTASVLRERHPAPMDAASLLIQSFKLAARNQKIAQSRMLSISDAAGAICIEDAVVAQLDFRKIMHTLEPTDREVLMLRFIAGRSWVEIAAMKGQSTHALRKRCTRALGELRRKFGSYLNPK
jgi:DNA-directed RNA polymerase specialized sigma24 family protein